MKTLTNYFKNEEKDSDRSLSLINLKGLKKLSVLGIGALMIASCSTDPEGTEIQESSVLAKDTFVLNDFEGKYQYLESKGDISSISKRATEKAGPDQGRFNISLKYLVPVSDRQKEIFESAAARWERIIIKDESSIPEESLVGPLPSAFFGFPALNADGPVDDVVIEVVLIPIDGPGKILGSAGPRFVRTSNRLTISGVMQFDTADLQFLDGLGLFEDVIVHEMGHVLGVGTLWNSGGKRLRQGPASNPYFAGELANVFWNAEGGEFELPVENIGGPGTAGGHWRESVLRNELMTGFLNLGENPLSRITAGSMKDLGYGAATVGEQYELAKGTPGVDISELDAMNVDGSQGINISESEVLLQPVGEFKDK